MAAGVKPATLQAEAIRSSLTTQRLGRTLQLFEEVDSTNSTAVALAQDGAVDGTVVIAEKQTAGKGRLGRNWYSPARDGLYCSIVLRPEAGQAEQFWNQSTWVPLMSAVAAVQAIEKITGLQVGVKWPNDLLIGEQKVAGLLCESSAREPGSNSFLILGIGLNVNMQQKDFPPELQDRATSLTVATGRPIDKTQMLCCLLRELEQVLDDLKSARPADLVERYTARCVTVGRRVRIEGGKGRLEGLAQSIGPDGSLRVSRDKDEKIVEVRAGDVIHVR
jgi:BirA family transcriptional regulator, biotin operon repressor / biotin---[acetyl-CoA-carboxylase] ligase